MIAASAGLLALHVLSVRLPGYAPVLVGDAILVAMPVLAIFLLCGRLGDIRPHLRFNAWCFSVGLGLWALGMVLFSISDITGRAEPLSDTLAVLCNFLYIVPVLLAVTLTIDEAGFSIFTVLDILQAALLAFLAYTHAFDASFSFHSIQNIPVQRLVHCYDFENFGLALIATLRAAAFPRTSRERRFFLLFSTWLWFYAVCAAIYNYFELRSLASSGVHDLLADLPWLVLCGMLATVQPREDDQVIDSPSFRGRTAIFLENSIAILFCLVMLGLGASLMARHLPWLSLAAMALALLLYGLRATIQQVRYASAQQELAAARDHLETLSLEDSLTRVANRRRFDQVLEESFAHSRRTGSPLSLLMLDIDHFKLLNDSYGHRVGDACLVRIAAALEAALNRAGDLPARYGGEEFAIILPDTSGLGAQRVAARIRSAVRALDIRYEEEQPRCVTVSIGIATCTLPGVIRPAHLIEAADQALYQAKQNGRDRVEVAPLPCVEATSLRA
ncbi:GGDEF domain-containing protein [Silvibacterium dinghuense]|nr:GGDEF domain-containing protein [Silvibacterium dinghuense]GGH03965.1 hypothetical protein GCM10011586_19970 [Silvibacterium dinghuense]